MESGPEGAVVALDVRTRQILALVGSFEGQSGGLDRATQSRRQPGSTFKPIVYSYAIHSRHFTAATLVDPTPDVFEGNYRPGNFEGWRGQDPLRLREALANSVNVVAVRVIRDVGPANVVEWLPPTAPSGLAALTSRRASSCASSVLTDVTCRSRTHRRRAGCWTRPRTTS
jgi:penicillin-binding protein 1A